MPDNQVEEIKSRLDIVEIVRGYMKLEKSGASFRGLCPFHHEKTPSLFVSPSKQLWKCFGCSVGGDMFSFIMQIEGVEFPEALQTLAQRAGVKLREYDPQIRSEKTRLYEICEKACQFFEKQLAASSLGKEALEYLTGRGISEESVKNFRLGFAPYAKDALLAFLRAQGYSPIEIFKAGVSVEGYRDRFRERIMFPIFDVQGQVIGFGGRVFFTKNQVPNPRLSKYINTPQTLLYDKSRVLYGLDKAKLKIRAEDCCMLVEGYTDVIMAHQAGAEHAVAVSGTALTEQQLDLVRRYTEHLIILFDMDIAGDSATKRGIDMAQRKGFYIKVITLPEGKDPAEIIQKNEEAWKDAVAKPHSIGDFYFQNAFSKFDKHTSEGRGKITHMLLSMIYHIPSEIEKSFWVQKFAKELGCQDAVIWSDLGAFEPQVVTAAGSQPPDKARVHITSKTKRDILMERMILLLAQEPSCKNAFPQADVTYFEVDNPSGLLLAKLLSAQPLTEDERKFSDSIVFEEEIFPTITAETNVKEEFELCFQEFKKMAVREELIKIQQELRKDQKNSEFLQKFQKLSQELVQLS